MNDDAALLRRYADEKSEAAFAELVRRHLDLVYSAALRRLGGDAHAAADVAQQVFTTLARDAKKLSGHAVLTAWLYTATRNAAIDLIRSEQRRATREQEAIAMHELNAPFPSTADWDSMRPVLDEAMDGLAEADRTAVLLRFFGKCPFAEIGAALNLSEDAARMRVERALDKLRGRLAIRGVTSTSAALGVALANNAIVAAPAGLAGAVTSSVAGAALAGGGAVGAGQWLAFMNTSKIGVTVGMLVAAGALGTAMVEVRAEWVAETAAASADARVRTLALRVGELQRRAADEARQAADAQKTLVTVQPGLLERPAPVAKPAGADAEELAGREFLAKHPEAQALVERAAQDTFEKNWGTALRAMNVTPAEREALAREVMNVTDWTLRITPNGGWSVGPRDRENSGDGFDAREQRLRALLGPERMAQFAEQSGMKPVNTILEAVAAASYDVAAPLTAEQTKLVTQKIMSHGGRMAEVVSGTTLTPAIADLRKVDWPEVSRSLAGTLAPAQLAALESAAASEAAKLEKLQAGQKFIVPATPRSGRGG
jgi:RNA polymerase sigma factor (sigma-70 family)